MIPYFEVTKIEIGPITLQAWGTMLALAFAVGIFFSARELKRRGGDPEKIIDASLWVVIASIVSARLFYILGNINEFQSDWLSIFKMWEGGATLFGGIVGAVIAYTMYIRKKKIDFWEITEPVIYFLPLGVFIGRIGCFLIHDHMGRITNVPWGMEYIDGTIRHETTIYNGLAMLMLFILFVLLRRYKWSVRTGFFTTLFLLWYGISRFITDYFRATDLSTSDFRLYGFTLNQYAAVAMVLLGLYLNNKYKIIKIRKEKK